MKVASAEASVLAKHPHRIEIELRDGVVIVGSDAHIRPGVTTTAMRAFQVFSHDLNPDVTVLDGDVLNFAKLSRHPPIGWWEERTEPADELEEGHAQLELIKGKRRIWPLGNHDAFFEKAVAQKLPELARVKGVHLKDHFPDWEPCWSLWINPGPGRSPVCIRHRPRGGSGANAGHTTTLYAGVSTVTGHNHYLGVSPFSDYWGIRYAVQTGTLAVPYGPQFVHYTEDAPVNWASGFSVLTFKDYRLLWPELVHVVNEAEGLVEFRGELIHV